MPNTQRDDQNKTMPRKDDDRMGQKPDDKRQGGQQGGYGQDRTDKEQPDRR